MEVSWRRGGKSIGTKNRIELQANQKSFDVGERLSMISTCYLDDGTHRFSEKNSMITIIILVNGVPKSGGFCNLDLSRVLNPNAHKECIPLALELPLQKCPIKNSRISLALQGTYLQEMMQDDRSIGSGISSALNYSDSNFSMSFQRRTFEAPSRDSASLHNGTSSTPNSEMTRYGSNKRLD
ncbi:MAG: N-terminal C2 domain-containing protein [Actinobacteria bacterium]|nr:N-terminal C2 domain-containing protein [Actinomycetota bacterium]